MSVFRVSSRYAKALIDLTNEHGDLDEVKEDIEQISTILKANSELQAVLKNPIIKIDKKQSIMKALFSDKVKPEILSFFEIMVRKGRSDLIYATTLEFVREYNELRNIVHAEVVSASTLSPENSDAIKQQISEQINAQVILTNKVDPSLIGGVVVKVGDRQVDVSLSGKLNKLERYLINQGV